MKKKLPPKSRLVRENQNLRMQIIELELKLERLNRAWAKKFALLAGIFDTEIEEAGTIGELRRWYDYWKAELDAIDPDDPDADAKMQELLEEYDIRVVPDVEPEEMIQGG